MYHIERSVFELSRTKDMSFIQFTRPLNQIEQTKNIRTEKKSNVQSDCFKKNLCDQVRMFYFRTSSIEVGRDIERSGTLYRKTQVEQNRPVDQALKHPRRFEVLFLSYSRTSV